MLQVIRGFIVADADPAQVMLWGGILLGCLAVLFVILSLVKRWAGRMQQDALPGFTLEDLRKMHKRRQISDEEFEKAKAVLVEAARRQTNRTAGPPKSPARVSPEPKPVDRPRPEDES